jgi:hypothetical protein
MLLVVAVVTVVVFGDGGSAQPHRQSRLQAEADSILPQSGSAPSVRLGSHPPAVLFQSHMTSSSQLPSVPSRSQKSPVVGSEYECKSASAVPSNPPRTTIAAAPDDRSTAVC